MDTPRITRIHSVCGICAVIMRTVMFTSFIITTCVTVAEDANLENPQDLAAAANLENYRELLEGNAPSAGDLERYQGMYPADMASAENLEKYRGNYQQNLAAAAAATANQDRARYVNPNTWTLQQMQEWIKACNVYPFDPEISTKVSEMVNSGKKLIRYKLFFNNYGSGRDPLQRNFSTHYKLDRWERVTSEKGQLLLTLSFNFDALSLWLLNFEVEELEVPLVDYQNCMAYLPENEKYLKLRELLMRDFKADPGDRISPLQEHHSVCHQVISKDDNKHGEFRYECCQHNEQDETVCHTDTQNKWVDFMHDILAAIKILILLCGPMAIQRFFFTDPIHKTNYVVPLEHEDHLQKTMLVKKIHVESDALLTSSPHQQREIKQFKKFRQLVKAIPSDEIISVTFQKLHVLVDNKKLMSEKVLPVGFFHYLYSKFLRCGMCKAEPLESCCGESLLGTWGPKFLWFKMFEKSECNNGCRRYISWSRITQLIGYFILLAALPLPYILRSILFYFHEEEEMNSRQAALDHQNLTAPVTHSIFQYLSPTHGGLIIMYIVYTASFLFLVCIRQCDKESCDDHIRTAIQDMRGISYLECFRMLAAHLVLPFEKFGVCGLVAAVLYYPFALPLCVLVILCYCVPTVYMTGRLLLHGRPVCFQLCPRPSKGEPSLSSLTQGTTSMEACLFLNKINPSGPQIESPSKKSESQRVCGISKQSLSAATYTLLVGVLCILQMFALLLMYAETIGFVVEACLLVLLGAIMNTEAAIKYIIMASWVIIYVIYSYRSVCNTYKRLSKKLFKFIKDQMCEVVRKCVVLREGQHKNTAFKCLSASQRRQVMMNAEQFTDTDEDPLLEKGSTCTQTDQFQDTINYMEGRLHWNIHGLVLYVDKDDNPRIPKRLFRQICELDAPGCPGPIHKLLGIIVKQFSFFVIFLLLMFAMLMILDEVVIISSMTTLCLTFASGLLPLFILYVMNYRTDTPSLNSYSFIGKVRQLIMEYRETWPVFDLVFTRDFPARVMVPTPDDEITPPSQASTLVVRRPTHTSDTAASSTIQDTSQMDPTHVDLLITIRDDLSHEYITENLRSEPCSLGSHGSLNSGGPRNSQDDPGSLASHPSSQPQGATGGSTNTPATNKPSNATLSRTPEHGGAVSKKTPLTHQNSNCSGAGVNESTHVDLIVDIAKGELQIRGQTTPTESKKNGIPMWPVSSRYALVNEKEPEAVL